MKCGPNAHPPEPHRRPRARAEPHRNRHRAGPGPHRGRYPARVDDRSPTPPFTGQPRSRLYDKLAVELALSTSQTPDPLRADLTWRRHWRADGSDSKELDDHDEPDDIDRILRSGD